MAPSPSHPRTRLYWTCQALGWGLYVLTNALLFLRSSGAVPYLALLGLAGVGATHALRALMRRQSWVTRSVPALTWRVVLAAGVLGFGTEWALYATQLLFGGVRVEPSRLLFVCFNLSVVYLGWELLYVGEHWLRRIRQAEIDALQLSMEAQTAELRALKSQLQPHFLFNALNSVRALISEDPARAQTMVTHLAAMLRYSLGARDQDLVPLTRELEAVEDYLALEGVRMEERLRVQLDVAPEARSAQVPVLLLQTLVENAIKHGIGRLPAGGVVEVSVKMQGEQLELVVRNPRPASSPATPEASGVGLANARARLRLIFGERASLSLELHPPDRANARVLLPVTT